MELKQVKIADLKVHPQNPRIHPDSAIDKLARSIKEFGWTNPVLISKDGFILAGHARVKAALKMGIKEVPTIQLDLTGDKAAAYLIADNKLQDETEWDYPVLKGLLESLNTGAFDIEITGFDDKEIEELMTQFHVPGEGLTDDDAIPEQVETICKTGDLWQLGSHRLLCGDSTKKEDVARLMGGEKADMVFTDPPYNIGYDYQSWDDNIPNYKQWCISWFNLLKAVSFGNIVLTIGLMNIKMWFEIENPLSIGAWTKDNSHSGGKISKFNKWEPLLFYGDYKKLKRDSDVFDIYVNSGFLREKEEASTLEEHSCNKPVRLISEIVEHYSKLNSLWLDFFLGSGSTLIACEKLDRRCYGMELDPHYCDVIIKRWEDYTGKKAVKI